VSAWERLPLVKNAPKRKGVCMTTKPILAILATAVVSAFVGAFTNSAVFAVREATPGGLQPFAQGAGVEVRARSLLVVDDRDIVRAALSLESAGGSLLRMYDEYGQERVFLVANSHGARLVLTDSNGKHVFPGTRITRVRKLSGRPTTHSAGAHNKSQATDADIDAIWTAINEIAEQLNRLAP
jgi:hypothetical protein